MLLAVLTVTIFREKLLNFMRWLSLTPPFKSKGPSVEPNTCVKYDLTQLIEVKHYILVNYYSAVKSLWVKSIV